MVLNCFFNPLWLDANIPLGGSRTAVLQQPLNQRNIIAAVPIYLGGIPFAKAVGADPLVTEVVTDKCQLLLHSPFCYWEDPLISSNVIAQAIVLNVLLNHQRNCKATALPCFLLDNLQPKPVAVTNNITKPQFEDITDAEA